jgi:hypothetical protein
VQNKCNDLIQTNLSPWKLMYIALYRMNRYMDTRQVSVRKAHKKLNVQWNNVGSIILERNVILNGCEWKQSSGTLIMLVLFIGIVMLLYCEKVVLNCNCKDLMHTFYFFLLILWKWLTTIQYHIPLLFVFIIAPAMQSLTVVEQQKHTIITILV